MSLYAVVEVTRSGYLVGLRTHRTIKFVGSREGAHEWASKKGSELPDGSAVPFGANALRQLREANLQFPEGLAFYGQDLSVNWQNTMYMVVETNY